MTLSKVEVLDEPIDWQSPAIVSDPYEFYRSLRRRGTLLRTPEGPWLAVGYKLCRAILKSDRFRASASPSAGEHAFGSGALTLLEANSHAWLRRFLAGTLSSHLAARQGEIVRLINQTVSDALEAHSIEVVSSIAAPVPVQVLHVLLGAPVLDAERLSRDCARVTRLLDPSRTFSVQAKAVSSGRALMRYAEELLASHESDPRDGLLNDLVSEGKRQIALTRDVVVSVIAMLLVAGHETTSNLIASMCYQFAKHPREYQDVRRVPGLIPSAVEEVARYDSPVQCTKRFALCEVEVECASFAPGDEVVLLLGAANRDPASFPRPETFDVRRSGLSHLSFSSGVHRCIGAQLGRVEAYAVLRRICASASTLELEDEPHYRPHFTFRGFSSLKIDVGRGVVSRQPAGIGDIADNASSGESSRARSRNELPK